MKHEPAAKQIVPFVMGPEWRPKIIEEHFTDWESSAFGFGYGTGEPHIMPALRLFLLNCPAESGYDYRSLENAVGPVPAWMFINVLNRYDVKVFDYGVSPRHAWFTEHGKRLREFVLSKTDEELIDLTTSAPEEYPNCSPDSCNCGPRGYVRGKICDNPFWGKRR